MVKRKPKLTRFKVKVTVNKAFLAKVNRSRRKFSSGSRARPIPAKSLGTTQLVRARNKTIAAKRGKALHVRRSKDPTFGVWKARATKAK